MASHGKPPLADDEDNSLIFVEMRMGTDTQAAEMEAGYTSEPTETPEPITPAVTEEAKPIEPQPDPFKEVLDRLEKFEKGHTTLAGQFGRLQQGHREIQERLAAAQSATTTSESPTKAQIEEASQSSQEWKELESEYPEWALAIDKHLDAKLHSVKRVEPPPDLDPKINSLEEKIQRVETKLLTKEHSDWREIVGPKESDTPFRQWLSTQPEDYQNHVSASWDSEVIGEAIDKFKVTQKKPVEQKPTEASARARRIEAAVNPRGVGGNTSPGRTTADEMEAGYNSA